MGVFISDSFTDGLCYSSRFIVDTCNKRKSGYPSGKRGVTIQAMPDEGEALQGDLQNAVG